MSTPGQKGKRTRERRRKNREVVAVVVVFDDTDGGGGTPAARRLSCDSGVWACMPLTLSLGSGREGFEPASTAIGRERERERERGGPSGNDRRFLC